MTDEQRLKEKLKEGYQRIIKYSIKGIENSEKMIEVANENERRELQESIQDFQNYIAEAEDYLRTENLIVCE